MKVLIEITCDNAAFEYQPEREVARILRDLAYRLWESQGLKERVLVDENGNRVGKMEVVHE